MTTIESHTSAASIDAISVNLDVAARTRQLIESAEHGVLLAASRRLRSVGASSAGG